MERRKKWIVILLSFHILLSNCAIARAEALPEFLSATSTVADAVMSYYASIGAGISNLDWINTLNSSLGQSFGTVESFINQGYLILNDVGEWTSTPEFASAIESTSAYASLGLNEMFNVSAEEVVTGGGAAVASGGAILAGSMGSLASTGVIPLFAGVSASYWAGIGLGTLIAHATGLYGERINKGASLQVAQSTLNKIGAGGSIASLYYGSGSSIGTPTGEYNISPNNGWFVFVKDPSTNLYKIELCNPNNVSIKFKYVNTRGSVSDISVNRKDSAQRGVTAIPNGLTMSEDYWSNEYLPTIKNGSAEKPKNYSPDIIGPNGNQQGEYDEDTQKYTVPDFLPQIDPSRDALSPVSMNDWLNFANGANTNTNSGAYPDNAGLFENMLNAIRGLTPDGGTTPDPDPTPTPTPTPTPVPDPDYGDPNPDQPEFEDQTETPPDPVGTGSPWILPDLKEKFPFCIPWDIGKIFGKFNSASRQAPYIHWRFHPNEQIDYTFNLDLEDFEGVAELLRMLELGAFIVGLAFATRYMIGAN